MKIATWTTALILLSFLIMLPACSSVEVQPLKGQTTYGQWTIKPDVDVDIPNARLEGAYVEATIKW